MFGQQIITSVHCYEVQSIKRTWRERLWSWPWRPWVTFKTFHKPVAYRMGNQIVCHPAMLSEIQQAAQHRVQADAASQAPVIDAETQKVLDFLKAHLR